MSRAAAPRRPGEATTAPAHHLEERLLRAQAGGTPPESDALVAACHLELCAACRRRAALVEAREGDALARLPGVPLAPGALERALARIAAEGPPPAAALPAPRAVAIPPVYPASLAPYLAAARFRFVAPGVRVARLATGDGARARLYRLTPGLSIPPHEHTAVERTLVLAGAIEDGGESFRRGDLLVRGPGAAHAPRIAPGDECVALVVSDAPVRPVSLGGRLLQRLGVLS